MTTTIGLRRRALSLATAVAFAATGAFALANGSAASANEHTVWVYVCKYVGTPGEDERLQTGQNPILVEAHSLESPPVIGAPFQDEQGRSVVIGYGEPGGGQEGEPEPVCPPELPPPPTETTPPPTTETTPPPTTTSTTTTTTTTETTPPTTETTTTTPPTGAGGGVTPGPGAPDTGGGPADPSGDSTPINGLIGTGLLLGAAGIMTAEAVRRRRETTQG